MNRWPSRRSHVFKTDSGGSFGRGSALHARLPSNSTGASSSWALKNSRSAAPSAVRSNTATVSLALSDAAQAASETQPPVDHRQPSRSSVPSSRRSHLHRLSAFFTKNRSPLALNATSAAPPFVARGTGEGTTSASRCTPWSASDSPLRVTHSDAPGPTATTSVTSVGSNALSDPHAPSRSMRPSRTTASPAGATAVISPGTAGPQKRFSRRSQRATARSGSGGSPFVYAMPTRSVGTGASTKKAWSICTEETSAPSPTAAAGLKNMPSSS